jgi:hypothetical protein
MILLIYTLFELGLAVEQHDNANHMEYSFIENETLRVSLMPVKQLKQELVVQRNVIEKLIDRYHVYTIKRGMDGDNVDGIWDEHFKLAYQRFTDRLLIIAHVCEQMFEDREGLDLDDPWDNEWDGRGIEFRK